MELKDLRTALFGFNKNDVCEYISQLNYIYEQKEAQKIKEQKDILEELNKKNEELNDYNSRLNQLENQIEEIRKATVSVLEEVKEQLNSAEKRISDLRTEQGYE